MITYICAACGGIASSREDHLDSGTTLTCAECDALTVVDLTDPVLRDYYFAERDRMKMALEAIEKIGLKSTEAVRLAREGLGREMV